MTSSWAEVEDFCGATLPLWNACMESLYAAETPGFMLILALGWT
jgi:hypothetical protein